MGLLLVSFIIIIIILLYGFASSVFIASKQTNFVLEGRHYADRRWISELRKAGEALVQWRSSLLLKLFFFSFFFYLIYDKLNASVIQKLFIRLMAILTPIPSRTLQTSLFWALDPMANLSYDITSLLDLTLV